MSRNRSAIIDTALLGAVAAHPKDLTRTVSDKLGVSRQTVATRARALVEAGFLAKSGSTRPIYVLGVRRRGSFTHGLAKLTEDRVWALDVEPLLRGLPPNVMDIAHHGVTEMVNNVIDHSEGKSVRIMVDRDAERLLIHIADDGIGIFRKIARALDLHDDRLALLELSKGKFTTDPRRHTGEGVFFTSRMLDRFQIVSGDLIFDHDESEDNDLLYGTDVAVQRQGTDVLMSISVGSGRTAIEVFNQFSSGPEDYSFAKTVVPVRLSRVGDENLVSRSQAKRLMQRVDQFRCVVLDFAQIASIGQAFSDEVFRVFANAHPEVELVPMNAVPEVQQMIRRAEVARDKGHGQL